MFYEAAETATAKTNKLFKVDTETDSRGVSSNRYWRWRNNRWNRFIGTSYDGTAEEKYNTAKEAEYNKQYEIRQRFLLFTGEKSKLKRVVKVPSQVAPLKMQERQ